MPVPVLTTGGTNIVRTNSLKGRCLIWGLAVAFSAPGARSVEAQDNSIFESRGHLWVVGDVQVPAVADTFALMRVNRYPLLSLGVALNYAGPLVRNLELTVYVYPVPPDVEDPVTKEFAGAVQEIRDYAGTQRNMTVTVTREGPFSLSTDGGLILDGMFAEAEYVLSGRTRRSLLYVFEKSGLILKYRITHESTDPPELQAHLDEWLKLTAEQIDKYPG